MRRARMAGTIEAIIVTPRPITNASTTVRGRSTSGPDGRPKPLARMAARMTRLTSMPTAMPMAVLSNPTIADSTTIERDTCLGVTPIARHSPISRTR